jgi:hypothetical protein
LATELGLLYLQEGQNEKALNKLAYAIAHDQVHAKALLAIGTEFQVSQCRVFKSRPGENFTDRIRQRDGWISPIMLS